MGFLGHRLYKAGSFDDKSNKYICIAYDSARGIYIVAVPGTSGLHDWLRNLNARGDTLLSSNGIAVHLGAADDLDGFVLNDPGTSSTYTLTNKNIDNLTTYKVLDPNAGGVYESRNNASNFTHANLLATLQLIAPGITVSNVVFTGHSMGGAQAGMLAQSFTRPATALYGCITFGCPKWCTRNDFPAAKSYINYVTFANGVSDYVTRLPDWFVTPGESVTVNVTNAPMSKADFIIKRNFVLRLIREESTAKYLHSLTTYEHNLRQ
jgi:hypothetical protein